MKRIGYIGLSTPSFYDYSYRAQPSKSDMASSPNPIIEGAFGAMLLYDELWFLCRSLCPDNMRNLPFVKFLDEAGEVPAVNPDSVSEPEDFFSREALEAYCGVSTLYSEVKEKAGIDWKAAADNHTHRLEINNTYYTGNCWSAKNVMIDVAMLEKLPFNAELITNSYTANLFHIESSTARRLELTELLILERVPQFLKQAGPYHPCIDEVRENKFLAEFRNWVTTEADIASAKDIGEMKKAVEAQLEEAQKAIFLRYLDPKGYYYSLAETFVGVGMDLIVPGSSTVKDLIKQHGEEMKKQKLRWQGFILSSRGITKNI